METFSAILAFCAGNSPVTGEFLAQRPVTRSFGVFFDLRLNKCLSKQWRRWWRHLAHYDVIVMKCRIVIQISQICVPEGHIHIINNLAQVMA